MTSLLSLGLWTFPHLEVQYPPEDREGWKSFTLEGSGLLNSTPFLRGHDGEDGFGVES